MVPGDRRLLSGIPTEIGGVVSFAIGASLAPRALQSLGLDPTAAQALPVLATGLGTLFLTAILALAAAPVARFALPLGALDGTAFALLAGAGDVEAAALLAGAPLLAFPMPEPPFGAPLDFALLTALLLGVMANLFSWPNSLIAMQRAGDAGWRRASGGPIRRGLLAASLSVGLAGALGVTAPGVSTAGASFAIHARVLSRAVTFA